MPSKNVFETFQHQVTIPVDVVFYSISDIGELADVEGQPMTEPQKK